MIIAIDGLAGTGKTSCANLLAQQLDGFYTMNTGTMFRAIGYAAMEAGIDIYDEQAVSAFLPVEGLDFTIDAETGGTNGQPRAMLEGKDVTDELRTSAGDNASSVVSVYPAVREQVLAHEHALAGKGDFIVDGRDIGTVVFPDAEFKFFLKASPREKARRRALQNEQAGTGITDIDALESEIAERDERDSTRMDAPCMPARDALVIDTDGRTLEEVAAKIYETVAEGANQR